MSGQEEINSVEFQSIIDNYEQIVNELSEELYIIKNEHKNLKTQVSNVIQENKKLSEELQNVLSAKKDSNPLHDGGQNKEILNNLSQQINALISEKDCVTKLWQNSVKTIDYLEDELKVFQAENEGYVPKKNVHKLKLAYEEKINHLELCLASTKKNLEETIKNTTEKIEVKHSEVDQSLENQASALKIVKNLETEILKLQKRLKETFEEKNRLEMQLGQKEDTIKGLKNKNSVCWSKVIEAVSVVEAALNEKDAALFRENEIKEENEKLIQTMSNIVKECEEKIKREVTTAKNENNEKYKALLEDLKQSNNEIKNKSIDIETYTKKCLILETEIERIKKGNVNASSEDSQISKLLILEKNLESTFQKLLHSEKQNIQLISEKETFKNDMDQMAGLYERNLKSKEIEVGTLKNTISRLNTELNECHVQINNILDKMTKLNSKIENNEKELREQKESYEKAIKSTSDDIIKELTNKYNDNIKELETQLHSKNEIYKKWKTETKVIIENMEKLVVNFKQEVQGLKRENKSWKEKLRKAEEKVNQYKMFLELISNDVNKISSLTIGNSAVS